MEGCVPVQELSVYSCRWTGGGLPDDPAHTRGTDPKTLRDFSHGQPGGTGHQDLLFCFRIDSLSYHFSVLSQAGDTGNEQVPKEM